MRAEELRREIFVNGFVIATVSLVTWAVTMQIYYMPRFKRVFNNLHSTGTASRRRYRGHL